MKKIIFFLTLFITIGFADAQTKATIYFESGKSDLTPVAIKSLDALIPEVSSSPLRIVKIKAYCDNTGNDAFNQKLSEERAEAVVLYFKKKNTLFTASEVKGYGESDPVAGNDDETGKAKNRRVEITVNVTTETPVKDETVTELVLQKQKTFNEKSLLTDLEVGKTLVLQNLNFEGGTAILLPEGKPTLEMLLKTMQNNPSLEIEIGGHVCCFDDMPLSILRAQSVYSYLIKNGIKKERMSYKGYSRSKPIYEDDRDEFHARANRRVEITVLKK